MPRLGFLAGRVKRDVPIPAGVDNGVRLRLSGEGEPSPDGGPPGDCYCFIHVREHCAVSPRRQPSGPAVADCVQPGGARRHDPGAHARRPRRAGRPGRHAVGRSVPPARRVACPTPNGGPRGDLLVQTYIEVPKKLNADQEALLRQLAELERADVTPHRRSFLEKLRDYFASTEEASGEDQA